ncbi:MAG: hypothetical protein ACOCWK_01155 [Tangfeifania sp.]
MDIARLKEDDNSAEEVTGRYISKLITGTVREFLEFIHLFYFASFSRIPLQKFLK